MTTHGSDVKGRRRPGGGRRRFLGPAVALLLATTGAACASAGGGQVVEDPDVTIEVENNLVPPTAVTILVSAATRPEQVLGPVNSQETERFQLRTAVIPGRYRLVAERADGARIFSRVIQVVSDGTTVEWDLELNLINLEEPEESDEG